MIPLVSINLIILYHYLCHCTLIEKISDSTAEYIAGDSPEGPPVDSEVMVKSGLHCVTVLIGAYDRCSGTPIMGVINQPFYQKKNNE